MESTYPESWGKKILNKSNGGKEKSATSSEKKKKGAQTASDENHREVGNEKKNARKRDFFKNVVWRKRPLYSSAAYRSHREGKGGGSSSNSNTRDVSLLPEGGEGRKDLKGRKLAGSPARDKDV